MDTQMKLAPLEKHDDDDDAEDRPLVAEDELEALSQSLDGIFRPGNKGDYLDQFLTQKYSCGCCNTFAGMLCCLTGIGCCYVMANQIVIPDGSIGLLLNDGRPELVGAGRHALLSPLVKLGQTVPLTQRHIVNVSMQVITVGEQEYGLGFEQGAPVVLGPGLHVLTSSFFEFTRFVSQDDPAISHGTVHRVIVQQGQLALAWEGNKALILPAGIYQRVSPLFKFVKSSNIDQQEVNLNPFSIITVHDGQVGISYNRGVLKVLQPGEHWLNAEKNQQFLDFLPTTQQVRQLKVLDVLTSDGLMVRIRGSVTFRISDPVLAIVNIGSDNEDNKNVGGAVSRHDNITSKIFGTIMRRANDTLASLLTGTEILSSAGLGFSASSVLTKDNATQPGYGSREPEILAAPSSQPKREGQVDHDHELNAVISHRFKESLTETLKGEWGVELRDMNVIDISVMDPSVKEALAEGVRANIIAVTDRRNAESMAETDRIRAAGESDAKKIRVDAEAYGVEELAKAQQKAGTLLEQTPVAVTIRLAETAANAMGRNNSNLIVAPDAGTATLMSLLGAGLSMSKAVGTVPVAVASPEGAK